MPSSRKEPLTTGVIYYAYLNLPSNPLRPPFSDYFQVLYNGALVANWCPVALHLAKFIEAEVMLLSALPLLSVDTPPKILQRLVDASRHLEVWFVSRNGLGFGGLVPNPPVGPRKHKSHWCHICFDTPPSKTNIANWKFTPKSNKENLLPNLRKFGFQRLVSLPKDVRLPKAQGQRASWAKHLSWTYGILGKELVDEGRSRLRRFRQYVRTPGSWMMPSWKEVIKWDVVSW